MCMCVWIDLDKRRERVYPCAHFRPEKNDCFPVIMGGRCALVQGEEPSWPAVFH